MEIKIRFDSGNKRSEVLGKILSEISERIISLEAREKKLGLLIKETSSVYDCCTKLAKSYEASPNKMALALNHQQSDDLKSGRGRSKSGSRTLNSNSTSTTFNSGTVRNKTPIKPVIGNLGGSRSRNGERDKSTNKPSLTIISNKSQGKFKESTTSHQTGLGVKQKTPRIITTKGSSTNLNTKGSKSKEPNSTKHQQLTGNNSKISNSKTNYGQPLTAKNKQVATVPFSTARDKSNSKILINTIKLQTPFTKTEQDERRASPSTTNAFTQTHKNNMKEQEVSKPFANVQPYINPSDEKVKITSNDLNEDDLINIKDRISINVSQLLGSIDNSTLLDNDFLLSKEDALINSTFVRLEDINTTYPNIKIDYSETGEALYRNFSQISSFFTQKELSNSTAKINRRLFQLSLESIKAIYHRDLRIVQTKINEISNVNNNNKLEIR